MASSYLAQIPIIVYLISKLEPKRVLDIGKGFGKYGFLIHEYVGIDNSKNINPDYKLRELSKIVIDAVEVDKELLLPHLDQIYNHVYNDNILNIYQNLNNYDLILMIDVIEHLEKDSATWMLKYFISNGIKIIVATPQKFFEQHLYNSKFEEHISFWDKKDFEKFCNVDHQLIDGGVVYLLSSEKLNIRGYGSALIKKLRRIFRSLKNEIQL